MKGKGKGYYMTLGTGKGKGKGKGLGLLNSYSKGRGKGKGTGNCYVCGLPGHLARNCPTGQGQRNMDLNAIEGTETEDWTEEDWHYDAEWDCWYTDSDINAMDWDWYDYDVNALDTYDAETDTWYSSWDEWTDDNWN